MTDEDEPEEITLVPINEPKPFRLTEKDAKLLINEITDICGVAQSAFNLPPTTTIERSANYYVEEILRTLKEYNIIEE
jgi:hypothetical protein